MVSVIIPNYNGKDLLERCLRSVYTLDPIPHSLEIIVVDNGSTDQSVRYLKSQISIFERSEKTSDTSRVNLKTTTQNLKLKTIENTKNYGFAKAVNQGIQQITNYGLPIANYQEVFIVVLNNDVILDKNWLKETLKTVKKDKKIAAVQGRNLTADGKKIEGTGLVYFLKGKCLNRGNWEVNDPKKYNKEEEVFGVSAAATLYRLASLEKVGYFDEDFFAFEEDVDLSLRLKGTGFKSFYNPKAIAYHLGGATVTKMGNLRARMDVKNWIFIIIKNYPLKMIIKFFPQILIERLKNLSGLIKQTIAIYGLWKSFFIILLSILVTYAEVTVKTPKILLRRKPLLFLDKDQNYC